MRRPAWLTVVEERNAALAAALVDSPEWPRLARRVAAAHAAQRRAAADAIPPLLDGLEQHSPATAAAILNERLLRDLEPPPAPADVPAEADQYATTLPAQVDDDHRGLGDTPATRVQELTAAAALFYEARYPGSGAQRYIVSRFGEDLRQRCRIGYAPGGSNQLTLHLRDTCAATPAELVDAGLARWQRRGQLVDVFRERVVFVMQSIGGDPLGFLGRLAPGADGPKYLNTPTTAIYRKGVELFGLREQADALRAGAVPVRVEGPMDAMAVAVASDGQAAGLAPSGTALTLAQAQLIAGHSTGGVVLVGTDHDTAGLRAGERDFGILTGVGLEPRELVLIDRHSTAPIKDPAEALQRDRHSLMQALTMPDIAPSLVSRLVRETTTLPSVQGHAAARVAAARYIGDLIAQLPEAAQDFEATSAAAALAEATSTPAATDEYRRLMLHQPAPEPAQAVTYAPPPAEQKRAPATRRR